MTAPALDDAQVHEQFDRLAIAHRDGSDARKVVTLRCIDSLLDRWNETHGREGQR